MWWYIAGIVIFGFLALVAGYFLGSSRSGGAAPQVIGIACCFFAAFAGVALAVYGPKAGFGTVDTLPDSYTSYLDGGVVYRVHHVTNVGEDHIVLLQKMGKDDFKAIRVTGPIPPRSFILAGEKPVEVVEKAPPVIVTTP